MYLVSALSEFKLKESCGQQAFAVRTVLFKALFAVGYLSLPFQIIPLEREKFFASI